MRGVKGQSARSEVVELNILVDQDQYVEQVVRQVQILKSNWNSNFGRHLVVIWLCEFHKPKKN